MHYLNFNHTFGAGISFINMLFYMFLRLNRPIKMLLHAVLQTVT